MTSKVDFTCLGPRIPNLVYFAQFNLHVIMGKKGNPGVDTRSNTWGVTQSAAAVTRRRPEPVSPSTSEPRRALCHGELRLDVRNPGHAPNSPLPP
jgi:hypothetical protein